MADHPSSRRNTLSVQAFGGATPPSPHEDKARSSRSVWSELDPALTDIIAKTTAHDRSQFQSQFEFDLHPHHSETQKHYEVDIYLFVPMNMGIDSRTYSREQFYNALTRYQRIRTPDEPAWFRSATRHFTIPSAERYLDLELSVQKREKLNRLVTQDVKLFGCLMNTHLKKLQTAIQEEIRTSGSLSQESITRCKRKLRTLEQKLQIFRTKYIQRTDELAFILAFEVRRTFFLVNEYLSYQYEALLLHLYDLLPESSEAIVLGFRQALLEALQRETDVRTQTILPRLEMSSNEDAQIESRYYRLSLLKKFVYEILYLQSKNEKKDKAWRNLIAAFGAALAAAFATLVNVEQLRAIGTGEPRISIYTLFFLAVLAYVLKDRIKDLTKEYFNERFRQWMPDFDLSLHFSHTDQNGEETKYRLGNAKENMRFVSDNDVPPDIMYIRNMGRRSELEPERKETILNYNKKLDFQLERIETDMGPIRYVKDIIRLDITEFLRKLSDPNKNLSYFHPERGIVEISAPKVYHLNVVYRYRGSSEASETNEVIQHTEYERVRVILDKHGIIRCEEVLPFGTFVQREIKIKRKRKKSKKKPVVPALPPQDEEAAPSSSTTSSATPLPTSSATPLPTPSATPLPTPATLIPFTTPPSLPPFSASRLSPPKLDVAPGSFLYTTSADSLDSLPQVLENDSLDPQKDAPKDPSSPESTPQPLETKG